MHADPLDHELVERLRRGEGSAYETLVRAHAPRLLSVARRILTNEDDARDAVQDAFLSAFRAVATFDGSARFTSWLHRILINAALSKLRRQRRHSERPIDDLLPRFVEDGHAATPAVEWRDGSEALAQREDNRRLVRQAIDRLPDDFRMVLLLRDIEGLDTDTVAQLLGVTPNLVKVRLHRARMALREALDPHFREDLP